MRYRKCSVPGCNSLRKNVLLHKFPRAETLMQKWLECIKSEALNNLSVVELSKLQICHKHFEQRFVTTSRLLGHAYPTLFSPEEIATGSPISCIEDTGPDIIIKEHDYSKKRHYDHTYYNKLKQGQETLTTISGLPLSSSNKFQKMASIGKKVLVACKTFPQAGLDILRKNGLQTTIVDRWEYDSDYMREVKKNIKGFDGIIWNTKLKLNAELIDLAGPQLQAVTTMSSGLDHIDLAELEKRNILLGSTPDALDKTVAELTIGLMIGAGRNFKDGIETIERGDWKFGVQWNLGQGVEGSTVGIVGLGGIGQQLVKRLKAFEVARFLYTGRRDKPEAKELGVERVPLEELLKESDYVILSCPYTNETKNMINKETLDIMKKTAVLVNIARGGVVDTDALYEALKNRKIFAAGLDVVQPEPINSDHPIVSLPNCLLIPHHGSATVQTRNIMATHSANNISAALLGQDMPYPVILKQL